MRPFCWTCHRPELACFCANTLPFTAEVEFALIVHPLEVSSTVGTAWILRRSISNLHWFRSDGSDLDENPRFVELLNDRSPYVLYPGETSLNLDDEQRKLEERPLIIVIDGTWSQAKSMLNRSTKLRNLPRISFVPRTTSDYRFKRQPRPECLSSVEGVHRVIEILSPPASRAHDRMIEIFQSMVTFQLKQAAENPTTRRTRRQRAAPAP